jgi:hypothetical protein
MVSLTFVIVYVSGALPWWPEAIKPTWAGVKPSQFEAVFTQATRIQLSSMAAFLIANLTDIAAFFYIKRATGNRMLWLRATGSTAISQLIDTFLITALAFGNQLDFDQYISIVLTSYAIKLAAAIGVTPIIYALHGLIERRYGIPPAPPESESAEIA